MAEKQLAHELHRECARSVDVRAGSQVAPEGSHQLRPVDAAVIVEGILLCEQSVHRCSGTAARGTKRIRPSAPRRCRSSGAGRAGQRLRGGSWIDGRRNSQAASP